MEENRRPIQARETSWARKIAKILQQMGFTPNQVSVASVFFAALACTSFILSSYSKEHRALFLIFAAVFIQKRLLCNLFDGMIAVEGGLKSKSGEVFNDFPDRPADLMILVGAGYSIQICSCGSTLGWAAGSLAILTAYVRMLGGATGAKQYFIGPMAKQHRMALITVASLLSVFESLAMAMPIALSIIIVGCVITTFRRLKKITNELESKY